MLINRIIQKQILQFITVTYMECALTGNNTVSGNQAAASAKTRYEVLDGLRGVAALLVICYHFCEGFASSPVDQGFNHGYLAVDFFFVLSGFVIAYAYDGRMGAGGKQPSMTAGGFLLRRLIRLQPMVIIGVLLGVISFMAQGCTQWDGTHVGAPAVIAAFLLGLLMIPAVPGGFWEVRGNGEMFPLNGPSWSLFFEYLGSVVYALILCRLSRRWLMAFVGASAAGLIYIALADRSGAYNIGVGWTAAGYGWLWGFMRMMFSFSAGVLLQRAFVPKVRVRHPFALCSAMIAVILVMPYLGAGANGEPSVINAIYDLVCTLFMFPAIVFLGACGVYNSDTAKPAGRICTFLGAISYPVYIIHYPLMYYFYHTVWSRGLTVAEAFPYMVLTLVSAIVMAWIFLRYYDEPVRAWLSRKLLQRH